MPKPNVTARSQIQICLVLEAVYFLLNLLRRLISNLGTSLTQTELNRNSETFLLSKISTGPLVCSKSRCRYLFQGEEEDVISEPPTTEKEAHPHGSSSNLGGYIHRIIWVCCSDPLTK